MPPHRLLPPPCRLTKYSALTIQLLDGWNTRNDKYAISFYYEGLDGKKKRKTCTGESKDMLLTLRTTFLTNLFYEKMALKKKEENIELLKEVFPKSLLKATAKCEYTVNKAVDGYLAFHKQEVKIPEIPKRKVATVC